MLRRWRSAGEEETRRLGAALAAELAPDGLLLLHGELGSGKTVLAQGVAMGLGIDPGEVQSPTFVLAREHRGRGGRLVHLDLYRLEPEETAALGLDEMLAGEGVKVVEWAERLPFAAAAERCLRLRLRRGAAGERLIEELDAEPAAAANLPRSTGARGGA
jgi:tRNA threonylcarbamoyladenosine biosynthesis protein TsaE